ncbi:MAG: hypothetical protein AUJ92_12460 [Armatimonadetes bacterium CG2_30_59_28]|nr:MAG: hypothetical protein AUJ92_12460 [Armatimonadetes bacterium CG2_30_59_28]PIU62794.1 MAG: hypothetical protein COS85_17480 [Armatimonadetes bacterium CG07_land_8_20_14_0_80_59_28]PIY37422.1 MAG: hypothetical protein COZ05_22440 [Armatimonadetes bacterium CG_4_10_14_3_um_filter_59_10]
MIDPVKSVKHFFGATLVLLVLLSAFMGRLKPGPGTSGKTSLVWVSDNNPQRKPQIDYFNKLYSACRLRLDPGNTGVQKIIVQSCAGVGPDIFDIYNRSQLQTYAEAGVLLDVTEAAKEHGFDVSVTYPQAAETISLEGRQYGFPCNVDVNILFYNKNLFDKYGVPYPPKQPTWEEIVALGKRLTIRTPDSPVAECYGLAYAAPELLLYQAGGHLFSEDGTRCVVDSPAAIRATQLYRDLMHRHRITPSPLEQASMSGQGGWGTGFRDWFGAQKIAMIIIGKWALISFRQYIKAQREAALAGGIGPSVHRGNALPPLQLGACLLPRFPDRPPVCIINSRPAAVNRLGPNRDKAISFLEYLASKEYCQTINTGQDALPGNKSYGTVEAMHNPEFPEEDLFNQLTLESTRFAVAMEISPFIDGETARRMFSNQIQRITTSPRVQVAAALETAAKDVNAQIRKNVAQDARLRTRFAKAQKGARQ